MTNTKTSTKINTKAERIADNILQSSFVQGAFLFFRVLKRVGLILAPASMGVYFIHQFGDRLVIGIGVGLCLYSLKELVNSAYLAEVKTRKRSR